VRLFRGALLAGVRGGRSMNKGQKGKSHERVKRKESIRRKGILGDHVIRDFDLQWEMEILFTSQRRATGKLV